MKKVAVFGNAGAGKSTLSKKLSEITGLPLYILDKIQFKSGGAEVSPEEYKQAHDKILAADQWIIDGFGDIETLWPRLNEADTLIILPDFRLPEKQAKPDLVTNANINIEAIIPSLENIANRVTAIEEILGVTGTGIGSNSWVISGKRTATGKPIVANDPHLAVQMPSIWYEVGLHCLGLQVKIVSKMLRVFPLREFQG